jgi:hypothetical protein
MGNVISGGGKYFAGKFKLGKIEGQILAGDPKAGFGPSKPCPPGEDCSDTESTADTVALDEITPSGGTKTNKGKQGIRDLIKSQGEYDKNTAIVSQNLAEVDSLKMVASGEGKKARELYRDTKGAYSSDRAVPVNPFGKVSSNPHVQNRKSNLEKLNKQAKKIQGPRPTL